MLHVRNLIWMFLSSMFSHQQNVSPSDWKPVWGVCVCVCFKLLFCKILNSKKSEENYNELLWTHHPISPVINTWLVLSISTAYFEADSNCYILL